MRKLRVFFTSFKRSLTDVNYYQDIVNAKFTFSLKYLYVLMFFLGLLRGITLVPGVIKIITEIPNFRVTMESVADELYPDELVVTIENGELSINVEEPYFIDFPSELDAKVDGSSYDSSEYSSLVAIDTNGSVGEYGSYNSLILLTDDSVVYPDDDTSEIGGYRVLPLREIQSDLVIDRQFYDELLAKILPYLDYIPAALIVLIFLLVLVFPFFAASYMTFSRLFYLLFTSILLLIFVKLTKRDLKYKKIYQLSMHTLTAPVILALLFGLFSIKLPFLSFTALFLAITGFVIIKAFSGSTKIQSPTNTPESSA